MNLEIAKKRINEVLRPDTMTTSREDFLATHVPLTNIELYSKFDPKDQSKTVKFEEAKSEEDVFRQFISSPGEKHQFMLVMGESGAGKSHLIRWFNERLENEERENEVILFVRRSDNTLKGTIKQLLDKPEISNIANRDIYKRLVGATMVVEESKLKRDILSKLINEFTPSESENDQDDEINEQEDRIELSYNDRIKLAAFLKYRKIENKLLQIGGPIDRIYLKVAQSGNIASDSAALFVPTDFDIDDEEMEDIEDNAGKDVGKMARKFQLKPEKKSQVANYLNQFIDIVIQRCSGLESGDFEEIFKEIRREIKKEGKRLTVLIEDITSFTGVNAALLNSLTTEHTGYGNDDLCRVSSVVGITSGYLKDVFKTNYRDRVSLYVNLPNDVFNEEYLYEFVGKYLNTMSMEHADISKWVKDGAEPESYPVHLNEEGSNWEFFTNGVGTKLCLYPFTKAAIRNLYNRRLSKTELRTPRYVLQYIVEPIVKDILYRRDSFPNLELKTLNNSASIGLRTKIFALQDINEDIKERLYLFAGIWGNGQDSCIAINDNFKLIAGIPEDIYVEFGLPVLTNLRSENISNGVDEERKKSEKSKNTTPEEPQKKKVSTNTGTKPNLNLPRKAIKKEVDVSKIERALETLERWVNGSAIDVGATTDNIVLLSHARDDINSYIFGAINWQSEGVSQDNLRFIKKSRMKNIIGFENQVSGQDLHLFLMKANRESQTIIEGFIRWSVQGKGTWNFEHGEYFALAVETWTERIKKDIIRAVSQVNGEAIQYFKYAFAFEIYRQIMLGQIKCSWDEYSSDMFIENQLIEKPLNTLHTPEWLKVVDVFFVKNRDTTARDVVAQYFNLIQGERGGSRIYLDRISFDRMFDEIKTNQMKFTPADEEFKDCVAPREEFKKDIYDSVANKIESVYQKEIQLMVQEKECFESMLGEGEVSSEDILELVECIKCYYDEVNEAKLFAQCNLELLNAIKINRIEISDALKTIRTIVQEKNVINAMVLMSRDPLKIVRPLMNLIEKLNNDMEKVEKEMSDRSKAINLEVGSAIDLPYQDEKNKINRCMSEIERVGVKC